MYVKVEIQDVILQWNKGVELSKNELLVIVNDDVNFDPIILSVLTDEMD